MNPVAGAVQEGLAPARAGALPGGDEDNVLVDIVRGLLTQSDAAGWMTFPEDFWCYVGTEDRRRGKVQGWKLHLTATPLSASLVLARATPILARYRCPFKFARTLTRVSELICRGVDRGSGGKFLTAYPDGDDDQLRALAQELHTATDGLPGPGILSDRRYRPGSRVHYRFGAFSGVPALGNDGVYEAMLAAPDGSLARDHRKAYFTAPAWAPRDPFASGPEPPRPSSRVAAPQAVLLDGRYVVTEVIRHAFTGGVYQGTDNRTGRPVVIKQARRYAGADLAGRDAVEFRRHEAAMLTEFADSGRTAAMVGIFEQQGDLFLVQEEISGSTLREWASRHVRSDDEQSWGPPAEEVRRIGALLVDLLAMVHDRGLVLRDFSPNNVIVTDEGDLRLIDLETLVPPGAAATRVYTPSYAAPEQLAAPSIGPAPTPAADLFSLGATLFYLVSGIDPVLPEDAAPARPPHRRIREWLTYLAAGNEAARAHLPTIVALLQDDPADRPSLARVRAAITDRSGAVPALDPGPVTRPPAGHGDDIDRMLRDGIAYLRGTMQPDDPRHLWPASGFGARTDACNVQHGAAGVLGFLVRAHQSRPDLGLGETVASAAAWIRDHAGREPRVLPGLYFGRSGTAWSLLSAGHALGDEAAMNQAEELARQLPLRWPNPDVCHGMSGSGLTQLRFWEVTGRREFLERACVAADAVAEAAERQPGSLRWPIPPDFASDLAGLTHLGFAHGVAGCASFLLAAGQASGRNEYLDVATLAAGSLVDAAQLNAGAAYWTSGDDRTVWKTHWCSGSSGIGTFLIRAWRQDGNDRWREVAHQAALAVRRSRRHAGPSQCHGLAGDGEFLLDLADITGQESYRDWAGELATAIQVRHALRHGRMLAPDETSTTVVADFNTGLSGVLAFFLRLRHGGPRLWLPEAENLTGPAGPVNHDAKERR
jgi:hypothetical protein